MKPVPPKRSTTWLLLMGIFVSYLSMSPAGVQMNGYIAEEMNSAKRIMAIFNSWWKHRPIPDMAWSRHGPIPVLFDIPFIKLGKFAVSEDFVLSFQPVLCTALLLTVLFLWLRKVASPGVSLLITLMAAFGTMLWPYAYIGLETKQSLFVMLAGYLGIGCGRIGRWPRAILFGVVCGLAVTLKSSGVILLPMVAGLIYEQYKDDWRSRRGQTLIVVLIVVAFCAIDFLGRKFFWDPGGSSAQTLRDWSVRSPFQFLSNVLGNFGSPTKGLFLFAPILLCSLWAIPRIWRTYRSMTIFTLLVTGFMTMLISTLLVTADEVWGTRYMHVAIAPLSLCIGAAWPRLNWRTHVPLAALGALGVAISFLGAFYYYGSRSSAMYAGGQNTMEWIAGDSVWNEVAFDARAFNVWIEGCTEASPWTPKHIWVWELPPGTPPWKTIDMRTYCRPQSFLLQHWSEPLQGSLLSVLRMYLFCIIAGPLLLAAVVWRSVVEYRQSSLS